MRLLDAILILPIFCENVRYLRSLDEPTFSQIQCKDNVECNRFQKQSGFQCSVCAEDKSGKNRCLNTFIGNEWFNKQCSIPKKHSLSCGFGGKCKSGSERFIQACLCPTTYCGQGCLERTKRGEVFFRMVQWERGNAFVKPGEITRFFFRVVADEKFIHKVYRIYKAGLGNYENLGEDSKMSKNPWRECEDEKGLFCTEDYTDLQFPFLLPENSRGVRVLKMKDKLKGYVSEVNIGFKTSPYRVVPFKYKVFVDYEHVPVLKCIPIIQLKNCASNIKDSSRYAFHRNERITITYHVIYLDDGAYLSTANEKRLKCTSKDTTWTWTWSKGSTKHIRFTYYGDKVMKEVGSEIGHSRIFNPFTLDIETYRINLRIRRVISGAKNENFDECYFDVKALPIKAVIDGGEVRTVIKDNGFTLGATRSYDPNLPADDQGSLRILWTCECLTKNIQNCENTCKFNKKKPFMWLQVYEQFYVHPDQLQYNAEYKFKLAVDSSKAPRDKNITPQYSYVLIKVADESVKMVTNYYIECALNCNRKGTMADEILFLKAKTTVTGGSSLKANTSTEFHWMYSKEYDPILHEVEDIKLDGPPSSMLAIKAGSFDQGVNYTFMLNERSSSETVAQYSFVTDSLKYEGNCSVEPKSGTKGLSTFDITCNSSESLFFEFYDKSEEDLKEKVAFNGRMLGTSEFLGAIDGVRITRGNIIVYIIHKDCGVYVTRELKVELSPWNITENYLEEIKENLTSIVNLQDLSDTMNYISFIPDIIPEWADKSKVLDLLLETFSQVELKTIANVKISASTMMNVLQRLNKPMPLSVDLELISKTLAIIKMETEIIREAVMHRETSRWMTSEELKRVANALLECLNIAAKCEDASTAGLSEELMGFDTLFLLRKNGHMAIETFDSVKDILTYIQAPGLPPVKLTSLDKSFQIWVMGNNKEYPVVEMLKKHIDIPFSVPQNLLETYSEEERLGSNLFFQAALLEENVFKWSKSDVKSKLVSLSVAIRKKGGYLKKIKQLSSPIIVQIAMEKNLTNTTVKGNTIQMDPHLDLEYLDLRLTVHRIDTPPKGFITIRFLYPPTTEPLRVLVLEDYRPDYELMTHGKETVVINSTNPEYPLKHRLRDLPTFLYMGILPGINVSVNHTVAYEFEVTTTLCQLWIQTQWSSVGCMVSLTTFNETFCECTHLSLFAAAFPVPPQSIDPIGDTKLFLTVLDNPLVVVFVITILIIYLLLVLWGQYRDNIDKCKGKVIVLEDNFPEDSFPYLVAVHTSARFNAGTTAHVGIKLTGKAAKSRAHILYSDRRVVLKRSSDDWFMIYTPHSLGEIYGIQVWHDNYGSRPDWYCEKIVVYDLVNRTESVFIVEQWLALREGAYLEANIMIATDHDMLNIKRTFLDNSVLGFRDSHNLLSVFVRHPRSEVTRVQRISILMCFTMVAMLCSIMFYAPDDEEIQTDDYQYSAETREIIISIETLFITAALAMVVLVSFKRSVRVHQEHLRMTRLYRKYEFTDALSAASHFNLASHGNKDKSLYAKYVHYVSKSLKNPPMSPVSLWEGEKNVEKRLVWYIIAWLSCAVIIPGSAYLVILYGLKLGFIRSQEWLTSLVLTMGEDIFVMGPSRIIAVAILLSMAFQLSTKVNIHGISAKDAMLARPKNDITYLNILMVKRSNPMYAPLSSSARLAFLRKKVIKLKWWKLIDFINSIIFVIVVSAVIYRLWTSYYHSVNHLKNIFSETHKKRFGAVSIDKINHITMVEKYLEVTALEVLFGLRWYNEAPMTTLANEPEGIRRYWVEDGLHKMISNPHVRQVRVVPSKLRCFGGDSNFVNVQSIYSKCSNVYFTNMNNCLLKWSLLNEDTNVYGEKWVPATYTDTTKKDSPWEFKDRATILWWTNQRFYGSHGDLYDVSGYGTNIGPTMKEAQKIVEELRETHWLDWYTRACFLIITVYNVNIQVFSQVTILFECFVDGSMFTSATVIPVSRTILFEDWELLFLLYGIYYVFRTGYLINRMGLMDYLKSINNVLRTINVFLVFLALVVACVHHHSSIQYATKYMKGEPTDFFDFDKFVSVFSILQVILSVLLCFAITRTFMLLQGGRRFLNVYYTLIVSLTLLLWLFLGFLLLTFVFTTIQYFVQCQEHFSIKELILPHKIIRLLRTDLLERGNVRLFLSLRTFVMYFVHVLFVVLLLHYLRIARVYKLRDSDSFDFVSFITERIKKRYSRNRIIY